MDFLPSRDMEQQLGKHLELLLSGAEEEERRVLVVPALESEHYRSTPDPLSKVEVLKLMDLGEILTFRYRYHEKGDHDQFPIRCLPAVLRIRIFNIRIQIRIQAL